MASKIKEPPQPPDENVWASAVRLVPELTGPEPLLIGDGGGPPFTIAAAFGGPETLDPSTPAVQALLKQIDLGRRVAMPSRTLRPKAKPPVITDQEKLLGWRVLTQTDTQILFGRGRPPRLVTAPVRSARGGKWEPLGASNSRQLRAIRETARASPWRLDPGFELTEETTELRVLLTEISRASGTPALDRLMTPELHLGEDDVLLRLFVRPIEGYVGATRQYETPIVVQLPEPLGPRRLRDGGVFEVQS